MTDRSSASIRQQLCESALGDIDIIFKTDNKVWNEDPISFRDFVISKDHMNFVPLSERQAACCYLLLSFCMYIMRYPVLLHLQKTIRGIRFMNTIHGICG